MKEKKQFSGDGSGASQWFGFFPYRRPVGEGVLELPTILSTAKYSGADHFFVEQDMVKEPEWALKKSFDYWKKI